jgi:hypothetical protein
MELYSKDYRPEYRFFDFGMAPKSSSIFEGFTPISMRLQLSRRRSDFCRFRLRGSFDPLRLSQ